ncbi:peptide arginase family protein [Meridianimarinicoccus aquatilis]|uniref:DUF6817 domain-containing protein n=1 Tax=Meridianimarinicoccus aquatilis TaxID=2552766 RepID=A0A4R6APU1_9RHOB|nr:UPF0489 family protein [Fluviibacterium aquatile]TDL85424.1 hypothetical protein E2L05_15665 [Fluviibacterium aquatile]
MNQIDLDHSRWIEQSHPVSHFICEDFITDSYRKLIISWLDDTAYWSRNTSTFYDQFNAKIDRREASPVSKLFSLEKKISELASHFSGVSFLSRIKISVNRLVPGQRIDFHTDNPIKDYETHRFIVGLSNSSPEDDGLFLLNNTSDISVENLPTAYKLSDGAAVFLPLGPTSFHAVTPLQHQVRYTLVISLWSKSAKSIEENILEQNMGTALVNRTSKGKSFSSQIRTLVEVLPTRETERLPSLIPHLVGTYEVLRRYTDDEIIQSAGLFHSALGTCDLHLDYEKNARKSLAKAVGNDVESLIADYSTLDKKCFRDRVIKSALSVNSKFTLSTLDLDLLRLDVANEVEQISRFPISYSTVFYVRLAAKLLDWDLDQFIEKSYRAHVLVSKNLAPKSATGTLELVASTFSDHSVGAIQHIDNSKTLFIKNRTEYEKYRDPGLRDNYSSLGLRSADLPLRVSGNFAELENSILCVNHSIALFAWSNFCSPSEKAKLVHFDSHSDLGAPRLEYLGQGHFKSHILGKIYDFNCPTDCLDAVSDGCVTIGSFIIPAVLMGWISEIIWISQYHGSQPCRSRLHIGHRVDETITGDPIVLTSEWSDNPSKSEFVNEIASISVTRCKSADFLNQVDFESRGVILDVDLDYFCNRYDDKAKCFCESCRPNLIAKKLDEVLSFESGLEGTRLLSTWALSPGFFDSRHASLFFDRSEFRDEEICWI